MRNKHLDAGLHSKTGRGSIGALPDRIKKRIVRQHGCWVWTGYTENGYARSSNGFVHREVYQLLVGPVPSGLVLDHICRVRNCLNPKHLEPVTQLENVRRGARAQQIVCKRGHPLSEAYVTKNGHRSCRACNRMRSRDLNWRFR
jgi:HNH endonuclease